MTGASQFTSAEPSQDYGDSQPIAVIGAACRFPSSDTIEAFWRNIADGIDLVSQVDADMLRRSGLPVSLLERDDFVPAACIVENADQFDAEFFGYSRQEAASVDPQQRIFLTIAWEALDSAGYALMAKGMGVGVFGAARMSTYQLPDRDSLVDVGAPRMFQRLIGNDKDYLASRTAFKLGLTGPALMVQTACSSSLVAVHVACEHIRNGECEMALAGGVGISFPQEAGYIHHEGMIFSKDGRCRPYDEAAQGTRIGNGAGIVLLKLLADALADGDPILAVIRGSAVNNDGAAKIGYTAPSIEGQAAVIREALGMAEVEAGSIGLVEGHGTGTPLGDPIEVEALTQAYRQHTDRRQFCALGSVKSNIGHADTAAGIASLLKAVMALRHGQIPPSLHFERPNPEIDFGASPFYVPQFLKPWLQDAGQSRRAAVSSFGIGGTNCHMILEAAPVAAHAATVQAPASYALALSAHSPEGLRRTAVRYAADLADMPDSVLPAMAGTLLRSTQEKYRLAVAGADACDLAEALEAFAAGQEKGQPLFEQCAPERSRKTAFLFTGQGSQEPGMGAALYEADEAFRAAYDRCAAAIREAAGADLKELMLAGSEELCDPVIGQPALIAFEYAMAEAWRAAGARPAAVMGHSLGELAAAAFAGILPPEDAMRLALRRAQLVAGLPDKGAMAVLRTSREAVEALLAAQGEPGLVVAADNGPDHIAIAGPVEALRHMVATAAAEGIGGQLMAMSSAFHSPMLEPILNDYEDAAFKITFGTAQIPLYSTVSGEILATTDATHWRRHLRQEVRFAQTLRKMHEDGFTAFIEVGPAATLSAIGPRCTEGAGVWLPSRRHKQEEMLQWRLARTAAFQAGIADRPAVILQENRISLPPRALNEKSHWAPWPPIGPAVEADRPAVIDAEPAEAWQVAIASAAATAEAGAASIDPAQLDRDEAAVGVLHSAYVGAALQALGCFTTRDERRTLGDLLRTTPIKPKFRQLLQRMLRDLVEAGGLQRQGRDYFGLRPANIDAVAPLLRELRERGDARLAGMIERGGGSLADMLSGHVDPVAVIFPSGSSDDVEDMYQNGNHSRYLNAIAADAIASYARTGGRPLRILEIGAGTGGTTWDVVHALSGHLVVDYVFTDAGALFLSRAKQKFRDFGYMTYRVFDMEKAPVEAGFAGEEFDIILAANVLHNAKGLQALTARLHGLLRPGGMMVLREITAHKKLFDFVFGPLVPPLDDMDARGGNLFAGAAVWETAARAAGFDACSAIPGQSLATARLGEQVLLFRKPGKGEALATMARPPEAGLATVFAESPAELMRLIWQAAEKAGLPARTLADVSVTALQQRTGITTFADHRGIALCDHISGRRLAWGRPDAGQSSEIALVGDQEHRNASGDGLDALFAAFGTGSLAFHIRRITRRQGEARRLCRTADGFAAVDAKDKTILACEGIAALPHLAEAPPPDEVGAHLYRTVWRQVPKDIQVGLAKVVVLIGHADRWQKDFSVAGAILSKHAADREGAALAVEEALERDVPLVFAPPPAATGDAPLDWQHRLIFPLVAILAEARAQSRGRKLRLSVLTKGAVAATPLDETGHPEASGIAGFLRVAANEYPEVSIQLLDVADEPDHGASVLQRLAVRRQGHFALRGGKWFEERLQRDLHPFAPIADAVAAQIATDGLCILTGGLSEMGLTLAGWLADHGVRRIALLGRNGPDVDAEKAVAALRARGVEMEAPSADAGDPAALEAALDILLANGAKIAAIFHLAGVVEDAPIAVHDEESFARVLQPKWLGALTCHRLEERLRPGLTVYFSSATTVFGPAGQAAHATANALLEGLAHHRSASGRRTVAVAWGFWADIRREERREMAARLANSGMLGLPTPLGLALLERAIGHSAPVVAAVKADWSKVAALMPAGAEAPHLEELIASARPIQSLAAPSATADPLDAVRGAGRSQREAALRVYLRARVADLLQRSPDGLAEDVNLIQLGLDSLMFLELSHRLGTEIGVEVTAETAFSLDSIAKLARHLDEAMPALVAEPGNPATVLRSSADERREKISDYLRQRVGTLLGIDQQQLLLDRNLIQLGLDSLMFLELSHTIFTELGIGVTAEAAFEFSTISALAEHMTALLADAAGEAPQPDAQSSAAPGHSTREAMRAAAAQGLLRIDGNSDLLLFDGEPGQRDPLTDYAATIRAARSHNPFWRIAEPRLYAEWDKRNFDLARFETVWNRLVERHDMLRAVETAEGRLALADHAQPYVIPQEDMSGLPRGDRDARLGEIRDRMRTASIDPHIWPRFDLYASKLSADTIRLHLSLDTRLADVESFQILLREIAVLMANPETRLPALVLSPGDYGRALEIVQSHESMRIAGEAWRQALETRPRYPRLPLATGAGEPRAAALYNCRRIVPMDMWREVKVIAGQRGATSTSLVLTVFGLSLGAWTEMPDFAVDLHYFNRLPLHAQVKNIFGDFSAAMPVAFGGLTGAATVAELIGTTQAQIASMRSLGDLSAFSLQRQGIGLPAHPAIAFTTLLGIDADYALTETEDPVLGFPAYEQTGIPGTALHLEALEHEKGLVLTLTGYGGYYEEGLIEALADDLEERLTALASEHAWRRPPVVVPQTAARRRSA